MKKRFISFTLMTIAVLVPTITPAAAQTPLATGQDKGTATGEISKLPSRQVVASASGESVRFTSLGELVQMRLEIIGSSGETVFDSDFKSANLIDWSLADKQGKRLADGSYLCVITVKDASGQITRKHALAGLRDQAVSLRQSDTSLLSAAQAAAVDPLAGETTSLTILEAGQSPATAVLAHDGTGSHLVSGSGGLTFSSGDLFSKKLVEQVRLTADGNFGIGITNPQHRLDVAGAIRASQGIIFPDGSIQFSAAKKTVGTPSTRAGESQDLAQDEVPRPSISGTGTTGKIPKWTDGPSGALGDSVITELGGSIGINGTPSDIYKLDVNGHHRVRGPNPSFYFTGLNANEWLFQTVDMDRRFRIFDNTVGAERFTISQTGNVGIGTAAPASKLTVAGMIEATSIKFPDGVQTTAWTGGGAGTITGVTAGTGLTGGGTSGNVTVGIANDGVNTTQLANGAVTSVKLAPSIGIVGTLTVDQANSNDGTISPGNSIRFAPGSGEGIASKRTPGGNQLGLDLFTGFVPRLSISNLGNVGIGATTPGAPLELRRNGNISSNWQNAQLRISGFSDPAMQLNLGYDTTNNLGVIQPGHANVAFKDLSLNPFGGNVGIGTTTPGTRLDVNGNIKSTNMPGGKARQNHTSTGTYLNGSQNSCCSSCEVDVDTFTIDVPATGVLFVSAFANFVASSASSMIVDFSLLDGSNTEIVRTTEQAGNAGQTIQRTSALTWMLTVQPGPITLRTHAKNNGGACHTEFYDHNLSAVYLPKIY